MDYRIKIKRQKNANDMPYEQTISFRTDDEQETVATALRRINALAEKELTDTEGKPVSMIRFETSCLQKKCGACAMVINGHPGLACESFLARVQRKGLVTLEPLRKFPVIADLIVDRSILFENLRIMRTWRESALAEEPGHVSPAEHTAGKHSPAKAEQKEERAREFVYEAARCLQCGCCLETCPNYRADAGFFGAAAFVPTSRLLTQMNRDEREAVRREYLTHIYEGCGKSLACAAVCPAGLPIERILASSNALSVWKRKTGEAGERL